MCILITKEVTHDHQKYKQLEVGRLTKVLGVSNHTFIVENFCFDNLMQTKKAASSGRVHHRSEVKNPPELKSPLLGANATTNYLSINF